MDPEETTQENVPAHEPPEAEAAVEPADDAAPPPDDRLHALERQAEQARAEAAANSEDAAALRAQLADVLDRYRALLLAGDPDVPEDLVRGETAAELEASYERAAGLVDRLRRRAAEQSAQDRVPARVPAGAPARRGPDASALSPQQKIMLGLQQPN